VARSLLEAEGIPCFVRGELLQEFGGYGWGRLCTGYNLIFGPTPVQVPRERSDEARLLLGWKDDAGFEVPTDEPVEE